MEIIKEINIGELDKKNYYCSSGILHSIGGVYPHGRDNRNGQTDLITFDIPTNVTKLDKYCFAACTNLGSITIPDSVKCIDDFCFYRCENLRTIELVQ